MEQKAIFEEKVAMSPKDMNMVGSKTIDDILLSHLKEKLEGKCSQHGFVVPNSLQLLSRSMGHLENGRFTGNIVFHIQAEGIVYCPYNGMVLRGKVLKKNKMGLYVIYRDSIRILIPRDLHIGVEAFDLIQVDQEVEIEIRKSRFQMNDPFILSVGVLRNVGPIENEGEAENEAEGEGEGETEAQAEAEAEAEGEEQAEEENEESLFTGE